MKKRIIYISGAIAIASLMLGILTGIVLNSPSQDAIKSIVVSDDAIRQSNLQMEKIIQNEIALLEKDSADIPLATFKKIDSLKTFSDKMVAFIHTMRLDLVRYVDGKNSEAVQEAMARDDHYVSAGSLIHTYDVTNTMNFMYNKRNVSVLTNELGEYRENILALLEGSSIEDAITMRNAARDRVGLKMNHVNGRIWEDNLFDGVMLVSAAMAFNQIEGEVLNAEYEMLHFLMEPQYKEQR